MYLPPKAKSLALVGHSEKILAFFAFGSLNAGIGIVNSSAAILRVDVSYICRSNECSGLLVGAMILLAYMKMG